MNELLSEHKPRLKVCVFTGARGGGQFEADAHYAGRLLALGNAEVVFGGSRKGMMGALANGVIQEGGKPYGIMPAKIAELGLEHPGAFTRIVPDMLVRKSIFWNNCDSFLALPGGLGTYDEIFEAWAMKKLGYVTGRLAIVNLGGYFDPLKKIVEDMHTSGFCDKERHQSVSFFDHVNAAVEYVLYHTPDRPLYGHQ